MKLGPDTGDAALDRQLFRYQEQPKDAARSRTPGIEAKLDTGDAGLDRQLFRYQEQPEDTTRSRILGVAATLDIRDAALERQLPRYISEEPPMSKIILDTRG